jgi:glycosyltransferase involved in cell wall biosynthesis
MTPRPDGTPRRLAIVNQREGGGATAVAKEIEAAARAAGFEVAAFPDAATPDLPALLAAIDRFRPDVVHAHCFYNAYPASTLKALGERAPTVFTLHDVYPVNQFGSECWECDRNRFCFACPALPPSKRWYPNYRVRSRFARERAWRGARAHLVFPTAWIRRRVAKTALADLPYRIIPNAVDATRFTPRSDARAVLKIDDRPLIVATGNMYSPHDDRKGHAVMFAAFDEFVRLAIPDARLVVVGRVEGLEAPAGATLLGERPQEEAALWYAAADVYAHPALGDNLPLTVLEASAAGAAVVASAVGGVPEIVDDGVTGLLVPPGDRARLGLSCVELLRDRARAAKLGSAARKRMIERHAPDVFWKAHVDLYESVTGGRRVTRAGREEA